jgi:hypothetical protein
LIITVGKASGRDSSWPKKPSGRALRELPAEILIQKINERAQILAAGRLHGMSFDL